MSSENGGETGIGDGLAVLDAGHLGRQTFGDAALEREVLGLFLDQIRTAVSGLGAVSEQELRGALHRLKGAARGVGAFALGQAAEALEAGPEHPPLLAHFRLVAARTAVAVEARLGSSASQG